VSEEAAEKQRGKAERKGRCEEGKYYNSLSGQGEGLKPELGKGNSVSSQIQHTEEENMKPWERSKWKERGARKGGVSPVSQRPG